MGNQPLAVGLTEACGPAQPTITLLAILHRSTHPVETMAECHAIACDDVPSAPVGPDATGVDEQALAMRAFDRFLEGSSWAMKE